VRPGTRRWLLMGTGVVLLAAASTRVPPINEQRVRDGLVAAALPESAQPGMMVGPLLAVGRAPLVDYLWMRATKLKDEGRVFDAYQLAETICKLQPNFASVWAFNAWNMAYNISVTFRTAEDRWRWIRNGYELLRDHGIPRNPRNTNLYRELAWIFYHKIGDFIDEKHYYYKNQFALLMEDILGPGAEHDYEGLAAAPPRWDDLAADPAVADFVRRLGEHGVEPGRPGAFLGLLSREDRPPELNALLADPAAADVRRRIELFWRARRLREEMKLDPARIVELRRAFGPMDFRLAEAHALYWANLGTEIGTDKRTALDIDRLNADRIELYCLQNLFRRGRLVLSPSARLGEPPMLMPDVRFADVLRRAFLAVSKDYPRQEREGPVHTNFATAMTNFMREAILRFNEVGDLRKSREYFDWLAEHYPSDATTHGYEEFLKLQWKADNEFVQYRSAMNRIVTLIATAARLIGYGDYEQGATYIAYARRLHGQYNKEQVADRNRLPAFSKLYEQIVHEVGTGMRPETYERVLERTGFQRPTTRPAG